MEINSEKERKKVRKRKEIKKKRWKITKCRYKVKVVFPHKKSIVEMRSKNFNKKSISWFFSFLFCFLYNIRKCQSHSQSLKISTSTRCYSFCSHFSLYFFDVVIPQSTTDCTVDFPPIKTKSQNIIQSHFNWISYTSNI
jgi:hypothetical protein